MVGLSAFISAYRSDGPSQLWQIANKGPYSFDGRSSAKANDGEIFAFVSPLYAAAIE